VGGASTWLRLEAFALPTFALGVADLVIDALLPSFTSWLPIRALLPSSEAPFSPLSSLYRRIFFLKSSHALSKALLSYCEKGFGGNFAGPWVPLAGGGRGLSGSSIGIGLW